jgi:hypothetical protein
MRLAALALLAAALLAPGARAADADADGLADEADNCTLAANGPAATTGPIQRDFDGDGYGSLCDADLDGDGLVNLVDLGRFKAAFFTSDGNADLDGDGLVNLADLARFRALFLKPPGPSGVGVPDGWNRVRGRVTAVHASDPVALPDARVFLRSVAGGIERPPGDASDVAGFYETPTQPVADLYEVCAAAPGFTTACHRDAVDFRVRKRFAEIRDLELETAGDALRGTILLRDGSRCAEAPRALVFDLAGNALVDVSANARGEYIAAPLPAAGFPMRVTCAGLSRDAQLSPDARQRSGERPVDWRLRNAPPRIDSLVVVKTAQSQALRFVPPGSQVFLRATAIDPDGDTLAYAWSDEADSVASLDAPSIPWTSPASSQTDVVHLEVSDGRGGVARKSLTLRIGAGLDKFVGSVVDAAAGTPIVGATVVVDGQSVATEEGGRFATAVDAAEFHLLDVDHPGYARHVERVHQGAAGLEIRLHPLATLQVDPKADIEVWDGTRGASVFIPAKSLVDPAGNEPPGAVQIGLRTFEPSYETPLGSRTLVRNGTHETYSPIQGVSVEIRDGEGRRYDLAPGTEAIVGFQAPDLGLDVLPPTLALSRLDETTGLWEELGEAARLGSRYEGLATTFSAWSAGSSDPGATACLRVVTQGALQLPARLRVFTQPGFFPGDSRFVAEYTLQERENAIFRLPANHWARLELRAFTDPDTILSTEFTPTGGSVTPAEPPYPYTACQPVEVGADLPAGENPYGNPPLYLRRFGLGDEATAQAYYQSIGAVPAKDTFQKWLDANGFVAGDRLEDVTFFNPNEIGLTRRANCKSKEGPPNNYACYVTKYGHVGDAPADSLWDGLAGLYPGDTVAMEYSLVPGESYERSVKFYIYAPADTPSQQPLKTHTAFDTDGDIKYVPNVCQHCHGAGTSQFVVFDPQQYEYLGVANSKLANVQERFRRFNSMVYIILAQTNPPHIAGGQNPGRELIEDLYGAGVFTAGTEAGLGLHGDVAYDEVVKPYCRTCHMFSGFPFAFVPGSNPNRHFGGLTSVAHSHLCSGEMPHAMAPQLAFWSSATPFLPALFGLSCVQENAPPQVQITAPSDGAEVGFGGLSLETYTATVSDAEDGSGCCQLAWTSDEGAMGYGAEVDYVFGSPGSHTVCATATDSKGKTGQDCISVGSSNDAPFVVINTPTNGQVLTVNTPVSFWGTTFDANEPYQALPCSALQWTFPTGPAPRPAATSGCQPTVTFATTGTFGVRLEASDGSAGGFDTASVNVQNPPAGSPPSVNILSPGFGSLYPPYDPLLLSATITSHGGGAITRQWTADYGPGPPVPISTANPTSWVPSSTIPPNCGSTLVEIRLNATDANGTGTDARNIEIGWGPC